MNPLFKNKYYDESSLFTAEGLLREARRQKTIKTGNVPKLCLLDPDGDLFRYLKNNGAKHNPYWACYHSEMVEMSIAGQTIGVVGCAVGSSYAVLVAEQLFASGCGMLISITSAGQILPVAEPPYFVLINKALRDEGTSYHYLPPQPYVDISSDMLKFYSCLESGHPQVIQGGVWTTDAPFRETKQAINYARSEGLLAVEMEAAALYAFAEAKNKSVICFAYVTNQMATVDNDFEKGDANGNKAMYNLLEKLVRAWEDTK